MVGCDYIVLKIEGREGCMKGRDGRTRFIYIE
jgi:hypothetical protein